MKMFCHDDHLPYALWCSCKDLVPEVPGLNPGGGIFFFFFLIMTITITLIIFLIFTVGGAWAWLFWVYVLYYGGDFQTIFFCLVCWLACKKKFN